MPENEAEIYQEQKPIWWPSFVQRIQRRLNTTKDTFGAYNISSAAYVLSSTGMLVPGASNGFLDVPFYLQIPTWISLLSSAFLAASSACSLKFTVSTTLLYMGFYQ
jgi:hypothetical protein